MNTTYTIPPDLAQRVEAAIGPHGPSIETLVLGFLEDYLADIEEDALEAEAITARRLAGAPTYTHEEVWGDEARKA